MLDLTESSDIVAPLLLGAVLRRNDPASDAVAVQITEVEAYPGIGDPASHTANGWTPRCATMFGPPGHLYVYASYGIHRAGNIVCRAEGIGSGILLRAGRVVEGLDIARSRRTRMKNGAALVPADEALARGPGNLGASLGLDLDLDGATLEVVDGGDVALNGDLSTASSPTTATFSLFPASEPTEGVCGKRIGISKNVDAPLRFWVPDDRTVTSPRSRRSGSPL